MINRELTETYSSRSKTSGRRPFQIRLVTSWATKEHAVDEFIDDLKKLW